MSDSMEWYWRMRMGLPPRAEDRDALRRLAPELFGPKHEALHGLDDEFQGRFWDRGAFRREIGDWLRTEDSHPLATVREGSCPQPDCPLRLGGSPGQVINGRSSGEDGAIVIELMTVAGGYKAKASAFYDMVRKVHSPKGVVKDILVTDPYIYVDKTEEEVVGGIGNFLAYLDCLEIHRSGVTMWQPPYASGSNLTLGTRQRRSPMGGELTGRLRMNQVKKAAFPGLFGDVDCAGICAPPSYATAARRE